MGSPSGVLGGRLSALRGVTVSRLCRSGADAQYMQYILKYNFTTNTLKAYLSAQLSSLSTFMMSETLYKSHTEDSY